MSEEWKYAKEYWTGDSRDGKLENGDGYHYYRMSEGGVILEAFEVYECDDGTEVASPLPEMQNVHWKKDLGFEDFEALEFVSLDEFDAVKTIVTMQ